MKQNKIIIYQVLPRLFGNTNDARIPNGSIEENGCGKMNDFTTEKLKEIRAFGATHIWYTGLLEHATKTDYSSYGITPDHPAIVKGNAGSPYAIKDYYDIDPDLAVNISERMKEFEDLIDRTHKSGMKVIIDFVPNHVARQYHSDAKPKGIKDLGEDDITKHAFDLRNNFYYIPGEPLHCTFDNSHSAPKPYKEYPAKATGNDKFDSYPNVNDWYETVKLNYGIDYCGGGNRCFYPIPNTWEKMRDILLFWANKGIDAFRCDMAEMVPCEFWKWVIPQIKKAHPELLFIAEVYNPSEYRNYIHNGHFDFLYDKVGLYDTLRNVICGYAPAAAITNCWQSIDDIQKHMLNFLENHDEQRIASDFFAGEPEKSKPGLLVSCCMNTNPFMIYSGQELGEKGMDTEGFSGCDGRTTIFDYWSIPTICEWMKNADSLTLEQKRLKEFYQKVISLAKNEKALNEGTFYDLMYVNYDNECGFNSDKQYAFLRKKGKEMILIVANFDCNQVKTGIRIPEHAFDFFKLKRGLFLTSDLLSGESQTVDLRPDDFVHITIPPHNGVMLKFNL